MGIWLHTDSVTTTDASQNLGKLGEILPDASVQTVPLCFDWGCRTSQTTSHVHVIPTWGVEGLLRLWMGIWLHTHTVTTTDASSDLGKCLKSYLMQVCKAYHYSLIESVEPFKLHPMSMAYLYEAIEHLLKLWMGIWLHTHTVTTTEASPDSGNFAIQIRTIWHGRKLQESLRSQKAS